MRAVRYVTTRDNRALAWARSGNGPALVKAASWLTHLEYDAESPLWAHWLSFFENHFDYLRYDERGCGLSDRDPGQIDIDAWSDDLARVIDAGGQGAPFAMVAMSQGAGAALRYAAENPGKVSRLVLIGGYARGPYCRDDEKTAALFRAMIDVFRLGFDETNPAFRDVFTRRFAPSGDAEKMQWLNDLCRRAVDAETGAALLQARGHLDVTAHLGDVTCPVLILHARGDQVVPLSEGQFLAHRIPGAELMVLDSENHILLEEEPACDAAKSAILKFLDAEHPAAMAGLTKREATILDQITQARSNKEIARDLDLSEKTVRNHATNIFAKLGVATRQEAIVKMKGG